MATFHRCIISTQTVQFLYNSSTACLQSWCI